MDEKKTFGAYILRRRKELGMTQKEFAQKLYVTESAVSKWERGLSYPDITLLRSICAVLRISEHELLTGSEDSEKRTAERLAQKYLSATKRWRVVQYLIYGSILLGCFLGNLLSAHTLDWFFIALTACMTSASVTLAPMLFALKTEYEQYSIPLSAGCFTLSLMLLLFAGCTYSGGDWWVVAAAGCLLGSAAILLPMVLARIPLPAFWRERKISLWLIVNTALLEILLVVSCLWSGGDWWSVAVAGTLFGLGFVLLPVLLRQMPLPAEWKARKASLFIVIQTALLMLLLLVGCWYSGGDWFVIAAVATLFGLGVVLLPVLLAQLPLPQPLAGHKTLLYFALQTIGLFAVLICADIYSGAGVFLSVSLPLALICLALPWAVMLVCCYLPVSGLLRASAAFALSVGWLWLFPAGLERVMMSAFGIDRADPSVVLWQLNLPFDFRIWDGAHAAYNIFAAAIFLLLALCAACLAAGLVRKMRL